MTINSIDSADHDAIAERIFQEANGDYRKALALLPTDKDGRLHFRIRQRFIAAWTAEAERIYAATAGNRKQARELAKNIPDGIRSLEVDHVLVGKFIAEDKERAKAIVERCYAEAGENHRLGYELANAYAGDGKDDELVARWACEDLLRKFSASTSVEIEQKIEASVRAVKTRQRRLADRINEIADGIRGGKLYGPRANCIICKKELWDPVSVRRGIGPECWERVVIKKIERARDETRAGA